MSIASYLERKRNSWAASTLRSETARLNKWAGYIDGSPSTLWSALSNLKPYARVTTWTRVTAYWAESHPNEENPYETFRTENGNFFKHSYESKKLEISYEEADRRIGRIQCQLIQRHARSILHSAQRYCESIQEPGKGFVVGKGSKARADLRSPDDQAGCGYSYSWFYQQLKKHTGLTPHDLRKLALTRAAQAGAQPADLMEIAGWSSITTAARYLQPKRTEALKGFLK